MGWIRNLKRARLKHRPFPLAWARILERNVPYYGCLPAAEQEKLRQLIQVFLSKKSFEGAAGIQVTDEMRVTIAAQACILQLNRDESFYPTLRTVIVYPGAYRVREDRRQPDGANIRTTEIRHGESWDHGVVLLSWDDVMRGAAEIGDGYNLVFHEFAHQLDSEAGAANGAPYLPHRSMYDPWASVLSREYKNLREELARHRQTFLAPYGAQSPAEFFAVVTELFFERPNEMMRNHPDLYEQLRLFYRQDPARYREC
jgi:Mlc titration factor MtfA (ptsG expression regulator)